MGRIARDGGHPDWRALIGPDWQKWEIALEESRAGDKVLIATGIGGHLGMTAMDSLLAVALTLRGVEVQVLLCDATLPACQVCEGGLVSRSRPASRRPGRRAISAVSAMRRPRPWSPRSASPCSSLR